MAKPTKTATPAAKKGSTWKPWLFLAALAAGIWFWPDAERFWKQTAYPWIQDTANMVFNREDPDHPGFKVLKAGGWDRKFKGIPGKRLEFVIWTPDDAPEGTPQSVIEQLECRLKLPNGEKSPWVSFEEYNKAELWVEGPIVLYVRLKAGGPNEKAWIRSKQVPLPPKQEQHQPDRPEREPVKGAKKEFA